MMNCDQAFDLMTDVSLDESAALQTHLDACPRCRQMYETLSPALGLFAPTDVDESPTDFESQAATGVELAERIAVRLAQPAPVSQQPAPRRPQWLWASVIACGLVLISAIGLTALPSAAPAVQPASDRCTWIHREAIPDGQRPEVVVLSCVACHAAVQQPQASMSLPLEEQTFAKRVEGDRGISPDDPAWLEWAVWPSRKTART